MAYHEQLEWNGKTQDDILLLIADDVVAYVKWYAENGRHLPEEFTRDPATWTQILRDIEEMFKIISRSRNCTPEEAKRIEEVKPVFFKYFSHLWL